MNKNLKYLIKVVKKASRLITNNLIIDSKDENNDLITNFDLKIETFISKKLLKKYPDFKIIGEEFSSNQNKTANYFTIDPIDGTINFANGLPFFGIQIAMVKDFKTCFAVLYFPKLNLMYYADKTGAYCNGKLLDLSKSKFESKPLIDQIYLKNENNFYNELTKEIPSNLRSRTIRKIYCASLSFCWVASGAMGAFIFAKDLPWDYMPGLFLTEKANGATSQFKYNNQLYFIAAVNKETLNNVINAIKKTQ